ncbi:MAG TPA: hypothetical protein VFX48_00280, partial [Saprospiraceae bacterium]|nr:hypothetical protein [Saprospiraceae bacterium]
MKKLSYILVRFLIKGFQILPFRVAYLISDFLQFLLQDVIRYRRKVVDQNLLRCFPEITETERRIIMHDSYANLADIVVEGIKGLNLTHGELSERYRFVNAEVIQSYLDRNESVIVAPSHIANWEWAVLQFGYQFPGRSIGIYKMINNPYLEKYVKDKRAKSSIQLLSTRETRLVGSELEKGRIMILMSDQNPSNIKDAIWVRFFGRETACLHGIEKYAVQNELPVFYLEVERVARGYYEGRFEL